MTKQFVFLFFGDASSSWAPEACWPPWAEMWTLALAVYLACKCLSLRGIRREGLSWARLVAYAAAWPGLDARAFLRESSEEHPAVREWCWAFLKLALGLGCLRWAAIRATDIGPHLTGALGMAALVITLHFGLFHLLSCMWRSAGWNAVPLMNAPLAATSVSEFWGVHWNRAFRDITHRFLFVPIARRLGPHVGLWGAFVVSGLVHELVITVPARGGYGGPTLYFLIQAAGIALERSAAGRRLRLVQGARGWLFTACVTLLPVGLLFPPAFRADVIAPFVSMPGGAR